MIERTYDRLWLSSLVPEQYARTCGYWYTLESRCSPFTAFRTYAALARFFESRKLPLPELPAQGEYATFKIDGVVIEIMHRDRATFDAAPGKPTWKMNNGGYRPAKIEPNGRLHFMNVNVDQPELHYGAGRQMEDQGEL